MVRKPTWMTQEQYGEVVKQHEHVCRLCGSLEDLTVDHIRPRYQGGKDELDNYQILCGHCNFSKGPRDDSYWRRAFYFDQVPNLDKYRTLQRLFVFDKIVDHAEWFQRPFSQISRRIYTVAGVVASGKTLAMAAAGHALNFVRRRENGSASRRVDKILILTKEQGIRNQTIHDLEKDIVRYQILPQPPSIRCVENYSLLQNQEIVDTADIWVSCIHMLYEINGAAKADLETTLARFPLICIDEPHWATKQALQIVDAATISLCFGFTGTPIDAKGASLNSFILFSLFGYQEAVEFDGSLKYLDDGEDVLGEIIDTVGIEEADYLDQGVTRTTNAIDPQHTKNIMPARTVAERLIHYIWDCDQNALQSRAGHRPSVAMPDLRYPMHGIICVDRVAMAEPLADFLNQKFAEDPLRYPRDQGWHVEFVHSEYEGVNGQRIRGKHITPEHAWMRCYLKDEMDAKCARILIVIGMGREGLNNPYCGVYGLTSHVTSGIFIVQGPFGRILRAVTTHRLSPDGSVEFHVPPARMDTPRIITHAAAQNERGLREGLRFILNMHDSLAGLPTMQDLIDDTVEMPTGRIIPDVTFTQGERYQIAAAIGEEKQAGRPIVPEELAAPWQEASAEKRQRVLNWIEQVDQHPQDAALGLYHMDALERAYIVTRELPTANPTDEMLSRFVLREKPSFANDLQDLAHSRRFLAEMYQDYVRQFHLGRFQATTKLSDLAKGFGRELMQMLGHHFVGERAEIYKAIGNAMRQKLGVPGRGRSDPQYQEMADGSQWDRTECHVMLIRDEVRREMLGFAVNRLMKKGLCPTLATAFQVEKSLDNEEEESWDAPESAS